MRSRRIILASGFLWQRPCSSIMKMVDELADEYEHVGTTIKFGWLGLQVLIAVELEPLNRSDNNVRGDLLPVPAEEPLGQTIT